MTPLLQEQLMTGFAAQAAKLPQAIFVRWVRQIVGSTLEFVAEKSGLDHNRALVDLPHPSGANSERIAVFLGREPSHPR
jgi:hypothetical protein